MDKSEISILIIDDDASSRKVFEEAVKRFGYKPIVVEKIEEALNAARIRPINAAIIDCMLPRMNGVQLAQELRSSRFGDAPIILVSGIFRDKSFAQDSISKTQAKDFLAKPVDLKKMEELLEECLEPLIDIPKIPLHALLSKPFASKRDRLKALESIEEVTGRDLPLILSILLDSESAGFLNVVTSTNDICGITLNKGSIIKVDTADSSQLMSQLLLKSGFLTQKDFEELPDKKKRGDIVKNLINESLVSPHVVSKVGKEQILLNLKKLILEGDLKINFVPERIKEKIKGVDLSDLSSLFWETFNSHFSLDWFENFYKDWIDHPMRLGSEAKSKDKTVLNVLSEMGQEFNKALADELTIDEALKANEYNKGQFFRAIHLIALSRVIIFDDVKRSTNSIDQLARLKVILEEIKNLNPFGIFEYFGAGKDPSIKSLEKIYREFAKSNHPDTISEQAGEELKGIANRVYSLVSDAYDTLSNDTKKAKLVNSLKQAEANIQMTAENLAEEGLSLLRRGRVTNALEKLTESKKLFPSDLRNIYWCWAKLKSLGDNPDAAQLNDIQKTLDNIPSEERRNPYYYLANGLLKKARGDFENASANFDKALAIEPNFLDLRREMSALKTAASKGVTTDTLTGELTSIVNKLFKKTSKK